MAEKMTKELLAQQLTGREYKQEITDEEIKAAEDAGLVIVFGFSDDTTKIRGAVNVDVNTLNDATIYLDENGLFEECECDCIHARRAKAKAKVIKAIWCKGPYVWHYETDLPVATFEIIDNQPADDLKFCQGVIFEKAVLAD